MLYYFPYRCIIAAYLRVNALPQNFSLYLLFWVNLLSVRVRSQSYSHLRNHLLTPNILFNRQTPFNILTRAEPPSQPKAIPGSPPWPAVARQARQESAAAPPPQHPPTHRTPYPPHRSKFKPSQQPHLQIFNFFSFTFL